MKILFLIKSGKTPSSRIRVKELCPLLEKAGFKTEVKVIPVKSWERKKLFRAASGYEITVLQKRLLNYFDFRLLRKNARELFFDFDDAVFLKNASPSQNPSDYRSSTRWRRFSRTVLNCDKIIVANRYLAAKVAEITGKAPVIIPSSVKFDGISPKTDYSVSPPPIIGWLGSRSTLRYLDFIAPALRETAGKYDFTLRVIADAPAEIPGIKTEFIPWEIDSQYKEIQRFDIGIMPLSNDPFSKGKAAFKLIQYMACGVPSVCSPVGMNAEVAGNNEYALKAENNSAFAAALMRLLEDRKLREKTGSQAHIMAKKNFSSEVCATKWAELLNNPG
jgi:glycosyltransferase involved in cell wall biosynthesis